PSEKNSWPASPSPSALQPGSRQTCFRGNGERCQVNPLSPLHRPNTLLRILGRNGPTTYLDPEFLASLLLPCLLCSLFVWFINAQPAAFALGRQSCQGLAQAQSLVLIKAKSLGNHRCPERQDRSTVDGDGLCCHRL